MPYTAVKKRQYSQEDLANAVAEIKNGKKYADVSRVYGIPIATLGDRVKQKYTEGKITGGRSTALSKDQEVRLVNYILQLCKIGYGVSKKNIPEIVKSVLDKAKEHDKIETDIFKNNLPSDGWVRRFLDRFPMISNRIPEKLGTQRAKISEFDIKSWFETMRTYFQTEKNINILEFLSNPQNSSRIFNIDETGFPLSGSSSKQRVLAIKGAKNVHKIGSDSKEQITVLGCCSADGCLMQPMVIFPGQQPRINYGDVDPDTINIGRSKSGWMTADVFFVWLSTIFYEEIKNKVKFPIILYMDGHSSHINLPVIQFCLDHDIILYLFLAHSTHIMQPLDIAMYGPIKKLWNDEVDEYFKLNRLQGISKAAFIPIFHRAWKKAQEKKENVISGFRSAGLVPFNPNAITYKKFVSDTSEVNISGIKKDSPYGEKIGITRAVKIMEDTLPSNIKELFQTRLEEGYNIVGHSDREILWQVYKNLKELGNGNEELEETADRLRPAELSQIAYNLTSPSPSTSKINEQVPIYAATSLPEVSHSRLETPSKASTSTNAPESYISTPISVSVPLDVSQRPTASTPKSPSTSSVIDNTASTSERESTIKKRYTNYEYSPFRKYLQIKEPESVGTKKEKRRKCLFPHAVTGRDYFNYMEGKEKKKEEEERKKEERKAQREKRKIEKEAQKINKSTCSRKRRQSFSSTDEEENVPVLDSSDEWFEDFEKCCHACSGTENLENSEAWIRCTKCKNIIHKECISDEITNLTNEQIIALNFQCKTCERSKKKRNCSPEL